MTTTCIEYAIPLFRVEFFMFQINKICNISRLFDGSDEKVYARWWLGSEEIR